MPVREAAQVNPSLHQPLLPSAHLGSLITAAPPQARDSDSTSALVSTPAKHQRYQNKDIPALTPRCPEVSIDPPRRIPASPSLPRCSSVSVLKASVCHGRGTRAKSHVAVKRHSLCGSETQNRLAEKSGQSKIWTAPHGSRAGADAYGSAKPCGPSSPAVLSRGTLSAPVRQ